MSLSPLAVDLLISVPPAVVVYVLTVKWPHSDVQAPSIDTPTITEKLERHPRLRRLMRSRFDPTIGTGLLLTVASGLAVAGLAAVGGLVRMVRTNSGLARADESFARWGAIHASAGSTSGLKTVSLLGGYPAVVVLSLAVVAWEYRRGLGRAVVPLLVLIAGGQFAIVAAVKSLMGRQRPNFGRLTGFSGASFPSGHATAAAATYAAFSLLLGRRSSLRVKAALGAVAAAITTAVAGSRVLLGVHWFTDVLAGVTIGWIWFTVVSMAFGGRVLRFGAPIVAAEAAQPVSDRAG